MYFTKIIFKPQVLSIRLLSHPQNCIQAPLGYTPIVPLSGAIYRHGGTQPNKMTGGIYPSKEEYFITALLKSAYTWDNNLIGFIIMLRFSPPAP